VQHINESEDDEDDFKNTELQSKKKVTDLEASVPKNKSNRNSVNASFKTTPKDSRNIRG
jgi:hypothetical protein